MSPGLDSNPNGSESALLVFKFDQKRDLIESGFCNGEIPYMYPPQSLGLEGHCAQMSHPTSTFVV